MQSLKTTEAKEIYQALKRSLQRKKGFGLYFVVCNPSQAQEITRKINQDFASSKKIESLVLTEEVPQLYNKIKEVQEKNPVDILLISGIEKSLDPYVKSGTEYGGDSTIDYGGRGGYYNLDLKSLPPLLSHLNLQRDRFKKSFPFALVFFLSPFAYRFFVRRSPDFFDWRSGVFEIPMDRELLEQASLRIINEGNYNQYLSWKPELRYQKIIEITELIDELWQTEARKVDLWLEIGLLYAANGNYEEAIASFDKALAIKPDDDAAWYLRGIALDNLGRNEE
ncbi:MAG TPA: hypothetical protein DCF68_02775, partial [Cyanothece sp. UBA12306]|nr:hypothetical protein [Cyanothece sp. UBA12306]